MPDRDPPLQPASPVPLPASDWPQHLVPVVRRYAKALEAIAIPSPTERQLLEVLLARDGVQMVLNQTDQPSADAIALIAKLDQQLRQLAPTLVMPESLKQWRTSLNPPENAWWWHLEPPKKLHPRDRLDWVWNVLTAGCLVYAAGCATAILQPFMVGGFSVAEAAAMIAQGAGLVLVGKGAFTSEGKEVVKRLLTKLNIPSQWYSEATFVFSLALLLITAALHAALPKIGYLYLQQGLDYRAEGLLGSARRKYEKALKLNPQKAETHIALGELEESLGQYGEAEMHYKQAVVEGATIAREQLGRIYLAQEEWIQAETILELALREPTDAAAQFPLKRHLGRAFLAQTKLDQAQQTLLAAIALEQQQPRNPVGAGMASCFLAQVLQQQGNSDLSNRQLRLCRDRAKPETLDEYQWLIRAGLHDIARTADTSAIGSP